MGRGGALASAVAVSLTLASPVDAGVETDGSLGAAQSLAGPNYTIPSGLGTLQGNNLFHSFGTFSLVQGEQATFTGPSSLANIIARVTGGASSIDGTIATLTGGTPNLFLLNPAGVLFGPNASLNVEGSFHVSTADYLKFADGTKFLVAGGGGSALTTAAPAAFGFLASNPAGVAVNGATLELPTGATLSATAGAVSITNSTVTIVGGTVRADAVASSGETPLDPTKTASRTVTASGPVAITSSTLDMSNTPIDSASTGNFFIRGGTVTLNAGNLWADHYGAQPGGTFDLTGDQSITLTGQSDVDAESYGPGRSAGIGFTGGDITFDTRSQVHTVSNSFGESAPITIAAKGTLSVLGGAAAATITTSPVLGGKGGDIIVSAQKLLVDSQGGDGLYQTGLQNATYGSGAAGKISVTAGEAIFRDANSAVQSFSVFNGNGGDISLSARTITVDRSGIGSTAGLLPISRGNAGNVTVTASESLQILGGPDPAAIYSNNVVGNGHGGNVAVSAPDILLSGEAAIQAVTLGNGAAGRIAVEAGNTLRVENGATIGSAAAGNGDAGRVDVSAGSLTIDGKGFIAQIGSNSGGGNPSARGNSGEINITVRGTLHLLDGGSISTQTHGQGRAGKITVSAQDILMEWVDFHSAVDHSTSINSASLGSGNAGTISVTANNTLNLRGNANISTNTYGDGAAGDVAVYARSMTFDGAGTPHDGTAGLFSQSNAQPRLAFNDETIVHTAKGKAGNILVSATDSLSVIDGGTISTSTAGTGNAGNILIKVPTGTVTISGEGQIDSVATPGSSGNAGSVTIDPILISVVDRGRVSSGSGGSGNGGLVSLTGTNITVGTGGIVSARATGTGAAGNVTLTASDLLSITDGGQVLSSNTGPGPGGSILMSGGRLYLSNATIGTTAASGTGGNITIGTSGFFFVDRNGQIVTSATGGLGNGGNITVDAGGVLIRDGVMAANAVEGNGGNLLIRSRGAFIASPDSQLTATSQFGVQGTVAVQSPAQDVTAGLAELSDKLSGVEAVSHLACNRAQRRIGARSSIVARGRGSLPSDGDGPLAAYYASPLDGAASTSSPLSNTCR